MILFLTIMGYLTLIITINELKEAGYIGAASLIAVVLAFAFFMPAILSLITDELEKDDS